MSAFLLTNLVAAVFLPPLSLILALGLGIALLRRHRRLAVSLILASTCALYALSTPWVAGGLQRSLEIAPALSPDALDAVEAIVVLGGGRRLAAPEYGGDTLTALSLERLRYAAHLHRASGLPLLVTGGRPGGAGNRSEGELMREILAREYGLATRWVEDSAATTWDNARLSAALLQADGVRRIALVSHAWHLRRALPEFAAQGLDVTPAGLGFARTDVRSVFDLLPSSSALRDGTHALHEWLGILWYKLRASTAQETGSA